jgi:hypothetical protein
VIACPTCLPEGARNCMVCRAVVDLSATPTADIRGKAGPTNRGAYFTRTPPRSDTLTFDLSAYYAQV